MWRFVLLSALVQVSWVTGKPVEPLEGPLWFLNAVQLPIRLPNTISDYTQRLEPIKENDKEQLYELNYLRDVQGKRSFSMFARLRPFSELGKYQTSIKQAKKLPVDFVSAETRAMLRPVGQPLRWG